MRLLSGNRSTIKSNRHIAGRQEADNGDLNFFIQKSIDLSCYCPRPVGIIVILVLIFENKKVA